ncbi:hypothetical protein BYT27DRAFT_7191508 [Phlegmacium glaucopus]|nr:hypothetical protein BYT27DRAFT_7191508 [Phlegmacium glaucopus]
MWSGRESTEYFKSRLPDSMTAGITGNAPIEIKELPIKWLTLFRKKGKGFAGSVVSRVKVTDVSILPNTADPSRLEGKVTCEIDVTPDMCNEHGVLAQGCLVTLLDEGTNISMAVASAAEGRGQPGGVSQTINIALHEPAVAGVKLCLVHTSIASDSQMNSARSEIWDATNGRLVASGTQLSMPPSIPSKLVKKSSL